MIRQTTLLAGLLLAALPLGGCSDTFVDPFLRESGKLSLTGALVAPPNNAPTPTQTLRAQAVRTDASPPTQPDDPAAAFQASVVTVDTFTGDSLRWDGRLTRFADGTYGQLFSASFRPRPGGTYDLVARRDTALTRVRLTMPPGVDPETLPAERRDGLLVEAKAWTVAAIDQSEAIVEVPCGRLCEIQVPAPTTIRPLGDGRIAVDVGLEAAATAAREILDLDDDAAPVLGVVRLTVRLLGPEWLRADDPTFSNVERGHGFVGTAVVESDLYRPSRAVAEEAGFTL